MGLIVGSIGTVLAMGFFDDTPLDDVGSGLGSLLSEPKTMPASEPQSTPSAAVDTQPKEIKFDYPELLLEEEYVLPPPKQEPPKQPAKDTQVAVSTPPDSSADTSSAPATTPPPQPKSGAGVAFVIQVGSFRKFEDADRVKANLAINGHEAYIQKVSIEGRGDFYRVRLGPYDRYETAQQATGSLTQMKLQPLVFRIKASG